MGANIKLDAKILEALTGENLYEMLRKEHPQTIALSLTQLTPKKAIEVCKCFPFEIAQDLLYRIAKLEKVSPEILKSFQTELLSHAKQRLHSQGQEIGGPQKLAEALSKLDPKTAQGLLENLSKRDASAAKRIRELMAKLEKVEKK